MDAYKIKQLTAQAVVDSWCNWSKTIQRVLVAKFNCPTLSCLIYRSVPSCPRSLMYVHFFIQRPKVPKCLNHWGQRLKVLTACTQQSWMIRRASLLMRINAWITSLEPRKPFFHLWVGKGTRRSALGPASRQLRLTENSFSCSSVHLPAFLPEVSNLTIGGYQDNKAFWFGISSK